jgi:HEAT repeat protein
MKTCISFGLALAWTSSASLAQTPGTQRLIEQLRDASPVSRTAARELLRETAALHSADYALLKPLAESADPATRSVAAEILGIMGVGNADAAGLLIPQLHDSDRGVRLAALGSLLIMKRNAAAAVPALMRLVDGTDTQLREIALDVIDETESSAGIGPWLVRLLGDPDASIRASAAFALDAVRPPERSAVLGPLHAALRDSVDDVRYAVLSTLGRIGAADGARTMAGLEQFAAAQRDPDIRKAALDAATEIRTGAHPPEISCIHRLDRGVRTAIFRILEPATSVTGDGKGAFRDRVEGARVNSAAAFNLTLQSDSGARALHLQLDRPATADAEHLGTVDVREFHTFYLFDSNRVIWNLREMLVGTSVSSPRSEFVFARAGRTYRLQFGPWGIGECNEPYAQGAHIDGRGTTPVRLTRINPTTYRATLPERGVGRLWDWTTPGHPVDVGLYNVSFDFEFVTP